MYHKVPNYVVFFTLILSNPSKAQHFSLSTLFSSTSLNVTALVSNPFKTTNKISSAYLISCIFRQQTGRQMTLSRMIASRFFRNIKIF